MEIEILEQQCGGTEFVPSPHRLHLGAQNAEGVDRLQFILPAAWAECTLALYLRRSDGVQLAAIPLDTDGSVTVDRRLTGSMRGQWMLAAMGSGGYTAYTRPGSYDVYATLPTDGGSEELPPSVYEQFVARVLESARAAAESARRAENGAADTAVQAALAQKAADKILADRTDADACAKRAEAAALRADATLTTVPATAAQLDRMTEAYAPLTPALLPYGVKKALTSAAGAAGWSAQEKAAALLQLGADDRFYSKAEADRKFGTAYTLPCATAAVLGGVKAGRGVTVGADGTLEVTRENLNAVLGFSLTEKLERLERMMNMDGKLVYTGAGVAGKSATSLTVPGTVNYIVVRMVAPTAENDANPVAAAADYGSTRIVRGGTAVAMVGGTSSDLSNGVKCSGAAPVRMNFADSGVLSIGVVRTDTSLSFEYPFNVEGYQYV